MVSVPIEGDPLPPDALKDRSPGPWRVLGLILAIFNILVGFLAGATEERDMGYLLGAAVGAGILWPGIVVLLFRIAKRFRNPRSSWKIFFWVSLLILVSLFGSIGSKAGDTTRRASLDRIAAAQNRGLPKLVDPETELYSVHTVDGSLIFNFRLVNADASEIDQLEFFSLMRPQVIEGACGNTQIRSSFLAKGVQLRYAYHDARKEPITEITVTESDCGS